MALLWVDGFESYSGVVSQIPNRYPTTLSMNNVVFTTGRAIGYSLLMNGNTFATPAFGSTTMWTVGFAFQNYNLQALNVSMPVVEIRDGTTSQVTLYYNPSTNLFSVASGATVLGTGTFVLTPGSWYYIEIQVTINPTVGSVATRVNQVSDISVVGVTQQSANTSANTIAFRGPLAASTPLTGEYFIDDIYICDGTTSINNTFLGDMKVEGVKVIAAGASTQWNVNVPNVPNYQAVQTLNDGIFIQSNTSGNIDIYLTSALNNITNNIAGVSAVYWVRNTDSTQHVLNSVVYSSGTQYLSSGFTVLNTATKAQSIIWPLNPATSGAWTVSGIAATEFGVKLQQ